MKSDTKKLLIQVISVLLFSIIVFYILPPKGGRSNEGEMAVRLFIRYLLICVIGLLISDFIIFMRRPRLISAMVSLVTGFAGGLAGSMLVLLFAILIDSLIGIHLLGSEVVGIVIGSVVSMVFSYNFIAKRVRW